MTAEEAIEMFERVKHGAIYLVHQRIEDNGKVRVDFSLCDIAIDALKKQIPMKPILCNDEDLTCPTCGADVEWKYYCEKCGQKIDHEEE